MNRSIEKAQWKHGCCSYCFDRGKFGDTGGQYFVNTRGAIINLNACSPGYGHGARGAWSDDDESCCARYDYIPMRPHHNKSFAALPPRKKHSSPVDNSMALVRVTGDKPPGYDEMEDDDM